MGSQSEAITNGNSLSNISRKDIYLMQASKHALIIGVDTYYYKGTDKKPLLHPLPSCKKDAKDLYKLLSSKKYGYKICNHRPLIGSELHRRSGFCQIQQTIIDFFEKCDTNQLLLFYFSGHGIPLENDEVFLATPQVDPEDPRRAGILLSDLVRLVDACKARAIVCIIDACYSGTLSLAVPSMLAMSSKNREEKIVNSVLNSSLRKIGDILEGQGKYFLLSGQGKAFAPINTKGKKNNSLYTKYVIEGLRGVPPKFDNESKVIPWTGSIDLNGYVTPDTLHDYVAYCVEIISKQQRPIMKSVRTTRIILAEHPEKGLGDLASRKSIDLKRKWLLKLLSEGRIKEFNKYRNENPNTKLDFSEADLSHKNLKEVNLSGANLAAANLIGANLADANLENASLLRTLFRVTKKTSSGVSVLASANLSGVNLRNANLEGLDLRGINLNGAKLETAKIKSTDMRTAQLQNANLSGADLYLVPLQNVNLRGADLRRINIVDQATLDNAILEGANIESTDLNGIHLNGAKLCKAKLSAANLSDAQIEDSDFEGAYLNDAILSGSHLSCCKLRNVKLTDAKLYEANLSGADIWHADIFGTHLSGGQFQNANLHLAHMIKTNLYDANLKWANLLGVNLQYADLRLAKLQYANLQFVTLSKADLERACLCNSLLIDVIEYDGLKCHGADFNNAVTNNKELIQHLKDNGAKKMPILETNKSKLNTMLKEWHLKFYDQLKINRF